MSSRAITVTSPGRALGCTSLALPPPPALIWGRSEQRLPEYAVKRYGYAKARRIGVMAAIGGKHKKAIRDRTPVAFRDVLIKIARSVNLERQ